MTSTDPHIQLQSKLTNESQSNAEESQLNHTLITQLMHNGSAVVPRKITPVMAK